MTTLDIVVGSKVHVRLAVASVDGTVVKIDENGILVSLDKWPEIPPEYVERKWLRVVT